MLTLKQASLRTGKSKQAIQQAIKKGKVSAKKNEKGEWSIDAAELFRVYEPINQVDTQEKPKVDDALHSNLQLDIKRLELENEIKDEKIRMIENRGEELEKERDEWREQAKRLALAHQPINNNEANHSNLASEGNENISGAIPSKNEKKLSSSQIWVIIALFILAILLAGAGGYYYSQLKPLSPPDSIQTIPQEEKQPSATFNNPVIPQSPLEYSSPVE